MTSSEQNNNRNQLSGPSDLIAALPGILGYFPQDSAIVMVFGLDGEQHSPPPNFSSLSRAMRLGPVVRTDLNNVSRLAQAMREAAPFDRAIHVAILVAKDPTSSAAKEAIEVLYDLDDAHGRPLIDVCWSVPEIATGNTYALEFDSMAALWRKEGFAVPQDWEGGAVSNVALSPAMRPLMDNGGLPALSRNEAYGYFARTTEFGLEPAVRDIAAEAYSRADDLLCGAHPAGILPSQLVGSACDVIAGVKAKALIALDDRPVLEELVPKRSDILTLATVLARSKVRDCLVAPALDAPQQFATVLLAMAHRFTGVIRANALSLWAIIATSLGVSSMASAALLVAQDELSGHSLSDALLGGLSVGDHDGLLDAVVHGSLLQRQLIDEESRTSCRRKYPRAESA